MLFCLLFTMTYCEKGFDSIEFVPNFSHNPYRSGIYSVSSPLMVQDVLIGRSWPLESEGGRIPFPPVGV